MLVILHKFCSYFLQGGDKTTMTTHDDWNKVPPMILTHESMKETRAFVSLLEEFAFDLLAKEHFFCRF
jgi:hypothetical protein